MLVQILTTVLGLILVLSLLSLLATTLMEWISALLKLKNRLLEEVLHKLLANVDVNARVYNDFINHSRYRQLASGSSRGNAGPSYLKPEDFQAILFDLLVKYHGGPINTPQDLYESINVLPDIDLKNTLNSLSAEVNGDPNGFRFKVQDWFSGVVERAGEWYKDRTRRVLFALGILFAILFNADTLQIFQALQVNSAQTREVLGMVSRYATHGNPAANTLMGPAAQPANPLPSAQEPQPFQPPVEPADTPQGEVQPFTPPGGTAAGPASGPQPYSPPGNPSPAGNRVTFPKAMQPVVNRLINRDLAHAQSPLGMGWGQVDLYSMDGRAWAIKILGWLITALAVSFGAGFWFDLLKKIVSRRPRAA